ncbi:hypothetical protein Rhow_008738 [Rhodococcus wratislaviensis]|uniref:Uncharacterized protein n=1 Tax=Rhodococcus wratislaviensis TaxID=44752 RepID=A0A402CL39_RHOWR|nr:hypothetical protein Rhow_008738 [Rhodococcus wratislaviensis]
MAKSWPPTVTTFCARSTATALAVDVPIDRIRVFKPSAPVSLSGTECMISVGCVVVVAARSAPTRIAPSRTSATRFFPKMSPSCPERADQTTSVVYILRSSHRDRSVPSSGDEDAGRVSGR